MTAGPLGVVAHLKVNPSSHQVSDKWYAYHLNYPVQPYMDLHELDSSGDGTTGFDGVLILSCYCLPPSKGTYTLPRIKS